MKRLTSNWTFFLLLMLGSFMLFAQPIYGQDAEQIKIVEQLKAQNPENGPTMEAQIKALEIPADKLEKLSTPDLLQLVLDYRFAPSIAAYNTLQSGFDAMAKDFNGVNELLGRKDVAQVVLARYAETPMFDFPGKTTIEQKGKHVFGVMLLELVIAQDEVLQQLTPQEGKKLTALVLDNLAEKATNKEVYGYMDNMAPALLLSRMLNIQGSDKLDEAVMEGEELAAFIAQGHIASLEVVETILVLAAEYIGR